jgi:hypothetical protein
MASGAIARGEAASRKTDCEKAYLDAVAIIFDASGILDHDQRVQRFSAAMAAVIYAMSLLKKGMPADPDLLRARKALAILNGVLKAEPDNPGVAHFIIHAADNPEMAFSAWTQPVGTRSSRPPHLTRFTCPVTSSQGLAFGMRIFAQTWLQRERLSSRISSTQKPKTAFTPWSFFSRPICRRDRTRKRPPSPAKRRPFECRTLDQGFDSIGGLRSRSFPLARHWKHAIGQRR